MTVKAAAKEKLFFPNLDGLRFLCFFAVFLYHCNGIILIDAPDSSMKRVLNFLFQNGDIGVNAFFVLSGFLITFLLIKEKKINNNVSLKNFYIRRILRIWPLFYIVVFFGFIVFPYIKLRTFFDPYETANFHYYLFFASNFDLMKMRMLSRYALPDAAFISVLWSVSVEEQFYLIWPVILKFTSSRIYPIVFSAIIIFSLVFRAFHASDNDAQSAIRSFHTFSLIGDMALGGMMAYYCSKQNSLYQFIVKMPRWNIVLLYVSTILLILFRQEVFANTALRVAERMVLATLFALIIAEQNYAENSFFKFSQFKIISKLGVYTYGLYCLHFAVISAVLFAIKNTAFKTGPLLTGCILSVSCLFLSVVVSLLSYHLYEKHFLKLKDKFSVIVKK